MTLGLPATDALISPSVSPWSTSTERAPGHDNALAGAVSMTPVMFSTWRDTQGSGIAPGQAITGLRVRSAYRPGLTLLYARSDQDYGVKGELPTAVKEQLEVMRSQEWQSQSLIVIGPVYPKTLPRDFVSNELSYGIARLTSSGQLQQSSAAIDAIKKALESVSRSGGAVVPLDQLKSVAQTGPESELINAVILSLR